MKEFVHWGYVGTEGYRSPGILNSKSYKRKSYKTADVWSLINVLYLLVENYFIFKKDADDKKDYRKKITNCKLEVEKGSSSFKMFITTMLKHIYDNTFTHEELTDCSWFKSKN